MKILALLTPVAGKTRAEFEPWVVPEEQALWSAYRTGMLRELYYQASPLTVSLMFEASDKSEVEAFLKSLPMIEHGLLDTRLLVLGPWVQFEALFDPVHLSVEMQEASATRVNAALRPGTQEDDLPSGKSPEAK